MKNMINYKTYMCPFCGKEIKTPKHHLRYCKEIPYGVDTDSAMIELIKHNFGNTIVDDVIEDYTNNCLSLPDLKRKYGLAYSHSILILKKNNIKIRSIHESGLLITSKKHKETCLKKYGVENISQLASVKEKKKKTFTEHYGVDNIWKTNEYKNFTRERWNSYSPEEKERILAGFNEKSGSVSKLENRVICALKDLNIDVITQFKFTDYFHKYDAKIQNTNVIIEVNGDFWHGNPSIYSEDDILNFPTSNGIKAKDIWKKDEKNKKFAEKKGYVVLYFWEKDLKNLNDIELKKHILNEINSL